MDFWSGCDLNQQRMASENDSNLTMTRTFTLPTEAEVKTWCGIWKENLRDKPIERYCDALRLRPT